MAANETKQKFPYKQEPNYFLIMPHGGPFAFISNFWCVDESGNTDIL